MNTPGMTDGGIVGPRIPPLSFPQGFSGNPVSFSSVPSFVWPHPGKVLGFPITNVGNDRRAIEQVGNARGQLNTSGTTDGEIVGPRIPPLSFPQGVSGNPVSFSSVLSFVRTAWVEQFVEAVNDVRGAGLTNVSLAVERERRRE